MLITKFFQVLLILTLVLGLTSPTRQTFHLSLEDKKRKIKTLHTKRSVVSTKEKPEGTGLKVLGLKEWQNSFNPLKNRTAAQDTDVDFRC